MNVELWGGPLDGTILAMEKPRTWLEFPVLEPAAAEPVSEARISDTIRITKIEYRSTGWVRHGRWVYRSVQS